MVDAVAENHPSTTHTNPEEVLAGLHRILSSSRGGNKRLLGMLNSKLASTTPDLRILTQPGHTRPAERVPTSQHQRRQQQQSWDSMGVQTYSNGHYAKLEGQMAQMAWPPLDLGLMMRSPSPLSEMLWENPMGY